MPTPNLAALAAQLSAVVEQLSPPVFYSQPNLESLTKPNLRHIIWAHVGFYRDYPVRRKKPNDPIPAENIQTFARLCQTGGTTWNGYPIVAGNTVILDWEGLYDYKNWKEFEDYVRVFRKAAPELKVSVNSIHWRPDTGFYAQDWIKGLTQAQLAELERNYAPVSGITDQLDFITTGAYLYSDSPDNDLGAYEAMFDLTVQRYQKPLYVVVNPCYPDGKRLSPKLAQRVLDLAGKYAATVIWAGEWNDVKAVFLPLLK